jgi:cephalosporin hydroxylase
MSSTLKNQAIKVLYPLYEKFFLNPKIGKGIAEVNLSQFGLREESDISDHLNLLTLVLHSARPTNIVELGTRGGQSTKVFSDFTLTTNTYGISIDLDPCPVWLNDVENWYHFVSDDCKLGQELARNKFWPNGMEFEPIDFLFIDTSHEFEHTLQELSIWVPLVKRGGWVAFHDTNLTSRPTRRISGDLSYGWNNKRGVTRAVEKYFQIEIAENEFFSRNYASIVDYIFHVPWNNGLTLLRVL